MGKPRSTEEAFRESEERYRTLVEAAREIICTVDPRGVFASFNSAFVRLTGWTAAEWLGRPFTEIVPAEDLPACMAAFETARRGEIGPSVRHRLLTRGGGSLSVESTGAPLMRDGRVVAVLGLVRDVTARVEAEEALAESRLRLRALFENAMDAILLVDEAGRHVDANPAAAALLGYDREELLALNVTDMIPPGYEARAEEVAQIFAREGRYSGDYQLRRKDGSVRHAEFHSVAHILPGLHLAVARDVTDRKRAEEELRRSRRRLEEAEAVAHVGCWEWELASGELTGTAEMYRLFGLEPGDRPVRHDSLLARVHPGDRARVDETCREAARHDRDYTWEARIVRPGGDVHFIHMRGHAVAGPGGAVERMIGIAQDITDRVQDEQVRRELVRRLISLHEEERAGLSRELHDGAGQALAALLVGLRRLEDARSLKGVREAVARQRELVAQTIEELGWLARGLRPPALDDLGLRAALERHVSDQAWPFGFETSIDAAGLGGRRLPRDVETALYRAAQEALANAGRHARARHVHVRAERDRRAVRLTVTDDGCGFDVERALRARGHLGLHTIRERAELLGGSADIRSRRGRGTEVALEIPLAPAVCRTRARAARAR